jgi:hypothetical protein
LRSRSVSSAKKRSQNRTAGAQVEYAQLLEDNAPTVQIYSGLDGGMNNVFAGRYPFRVLLAQVQPYASYWPQTSLFPWVNNGSLPSRWFGTLTDMDGIGQPGVSALPGYFFPEYRKQSRRLLTKPAHISVVARHVRADPRRFDRSQRPRIIRHAPHPPGLQHARGGCKVTEWRGGARRARPTREAAFASPKAPLRPVPVPVGLTDAREEREASGRRRILRFGSRKTTARPARSS